MSEKPAPQAGRLKDAIRAARIEAAERTGVVVDLRDAELARLELLNEALDPLFAEISQQVELFDRGISLGDTPRLWLDPIAHVQMGRDKRAYRFLQDTRYGRKVLAEATEIDEIVQAVTKYVARRLVERERALADDAGPALATPSAVGPRWRWRWRGWRTVAAFALGLIVGVAVLFAAAWLSAQP
jgi:hypothetical protein